MGKEYLSIQTLESLNGINHKISVFFFPEIYQVKSCYINHSFTVLVSSMATPFPIIIINFFFHYRENVFSNIIMLFDAMWNHSSSGFRSSSIRDIPIFAQKL